jgi:predicted permease
MLVGFAAAKAKIIQENNASLLSGFILKISLPLLIITTISHQPFHLNALKNLILGFILSYAALLLLYISGKLFSNSLHLQKDEKKIFELHSIFGNVVFIGFPFIGSLFPSGEGLLYAAIFQLASDSILWTAGIASLQTNDESSKKINLKKLVNVNTIAFVIAIFLWISGLKIPPLIEKPFADIGHTTTVLSLIYVGYILSQVSIGKTFKKFSIYVLSFNKLLIVPFIVLFLLKIIFPALDKPLVSAIVLQTGMPAMTTIAILAKEYLSDDTIASENILVSTIISSISLPLLWFLINLIYP